MQLPKETAKFLIRISLPFRCTLTLSVGELILLRKASIWKVRRPESISNALEPCDLPRPTHLSLDRTKPEGSRIPAAWF